MEFDARDASHPLGQIVAQQVRTLQIITTALVMGICMAGMVMIPQGMQRNAPPAPVQGAPAGPEAPPAPAADPPRLGTLSMLAVGLLVACGTAATIIPRAIVAAQVKRIAETGGAKSAQDPEARQAFLRQLLGAFQTQHIVRAALVEGPAFLGLAAYMIEGHMAALVVPAVSIALLFTTFPTPDRVTAWLEQCLASDR